MNYIPRPETTASPVPTFSRVRGFQRVGDVTRPFVVENVTKTWYEADNTILVVEQPGCVVRFPLQHVLEWSEVLDFSQ